MLLSKIEELMGEEWNSRATTMFQRESVSVVCGRSKRWPLLIKKEL